MRAVSIFARILGALQIGGTAGRNDSGAMLSRAARRGGFRHFAQLGGRGEYIYNSRINWPRALKYLRRAGRPVFALAPAAFFVQLAAVIRRRK
jgi:hypothetical protein